MDYNIGSKIKKRRMELSLTQKDLADGICTQAQISNVEKGILNPSSAVLFEISKKLFVDMNYFFHNKSSQSSEHFRKVETMINQLKTERNYYSIRYIVDNELLINRKKFTEFEIRFLNWHKGIYTYYLTNSFDKSINILENLINTEDKTLHPLYDLQSIEIKTSMAIIYQEEKLYDKAYEKYLESLKELSLINNSKEHFQVKLKIIFGLSQTLTHLKQYSKSKSYCLKGINVCIENNTLYLLADYHYQVGFNCIKLEHKEEGMEYINIALALYKIQGNTTMINIVLDQLERITK